MNILNSVFLFLKKHLPGIIILMIAGNIFYFIRNTDPKSDYYSGILRIRSNAAFYDRLHLILGKSSPDGTNNVNWKYHSYHNEDHYIFEIDIFSTDSSLIAPEAAKIATRIDTDTMIQNYFYRRLKDMERLSVQNKKAYDKVLNEKDSSGMHEYLITSLMINEVNLKNNVLNAQREIQIYPFTQDDIVFVKSDLFKKLLRQNLIFLVLGLFISIAVQELSKRESSS